MKNKFDNSEHKNIGNLNKLGNQYNQSRYEDKTDGDFRRSYDSMVTSERIQNTNWSSESNYHNSYRVNGKNVIGRTLKFKK